MRAAFCRGPGSLVVEEVPRPEPRAGEVLVRVRSCGICGSDLHWWHDQMMVPTVCPGHEIAGEVAGKDLPLGKRVKVSGTLFGAHTMWHAEGVLIDATDVTPE